MSKDKPSPFRRASADTEPREFERHGLFKRWVTRRPPELVPLDNATWGFKPLSDAGPRGLDWVRFQAENARAFLDARDLSRNPYRLEDADYGPLSNEVLAARLIEAADIALSENMPLETRLDYAVKFGGLETMLDVLHTADEKMPTPPEERAKPWAKELARDLVRERPEATYKDLWRGLPQEMGERVLFLSGERWYVWRGEHTHKDGRSTECLWALPADDEDAVRQRGPGFRRFSDDYLAEARK